MFSSTVDILIVRPYGNENEWTAAKCSSMYDPHKHNSERKKPDTEYILCVFFYIKFQNR